MIGIVSHGSYMKISVTGQTNNSLLSKEHILWTMNEQLYEINKPIVIIFIILVLVGLLGNSTVIYIFGFRLNKNSIQKYITAIAVVDTLTCILLIFEIFDKRFPMYIGIYTEICKTVRFLEVFANGCSTLIMSIIAFDRYYKICKPFKRLPKKMVRTALICIVAFMLFLSWPMVLFHGTESIKTVHPTVFGADCADDDNFKGSIYSGIYFIIIFVIILLCIIEVVIMYLLLFLRILKWKNSTIRKSIARVSVNPDLRFSTCKPNTFLTIIKHKEENTASKSENDTPEARSSFKEDKQSNKITQDDEMLKIKTNISVINLPKEQHGQSHNSTLMERNKHEQVETNSKETFTENGHPLKRRKEAKLGMTTVMLSLTALLYVLCYIPTIVVECINAFSPLSFQALSISTRKILVVCNSSYFINIGFNPIIYGVFNDNFRNEVKAIVFGETK